MLGGVETSELAVQHGLLFVTVVCNRLSWSALVGQVSKTDGGELVTMGDTWAMPLSRKISVARQPWAEDAACT
ncbi:hypothetical protein JTE90_018939 [Oedothorax gibbosus]|uniref:Uncharacterized protein n=1 Tax=Oedothorax gibbosus TaxID=931172 RepID=A0AAV6VTA4_9ARAC|nr:hypothetical protein JTE90_018939 [Oedothorax gibbosus]